MSNDQTQTPDMSMKVEVTADHKWLMNFLGQWSFEGECSGAPGQPPMKSTGNASFRALGELWLVGELDGKAPDGEDVISIMTLGYDPAQSCYVGTFTASCMTHLWVYEGGVREGNVLTLNAKGPNMMKPGEMSDYQDIVEYIDADNHTLKSQVRGEDGKWTQFMQSHYTRKSSK